MDQDTCEAIIRKVLPVHDAVPKAPAAKRRPAARKTATRKTAKAA